MEITSPAPGRNKFSTGWETTSWKGWQAKTCDLVHNDLNVTQQCTIMTKKTSSTLSCIRKSIASRLTEVGSLLTWVIWWFCVILPLCTALAMSRVLFAGLGSPVQWRHEYTGVNSAKGMKVLEDLSYMEALRELRLLNLKKGSFKTCCRGGDIRTSFKCRHLGRRSEDDRHRFFSVLFFVRIKNNGKHWFRKFHLEKIYIHIAVRMVKYWRTLPTEFVVESQRTVSNPLQLTVL